MSIRFTLNGAPRTKKTHNRVFRAGGRIRVMPSAAWQQWRDTCSLERGKLLYVHPAGYERDYATVDFPVNCEAVFYRDARRGDAVGYYQGLADVLEFFSIVENDKYIESWDGSRLLLDRDNPRVEVTLTRISG